MARSGVDSEEQSSAQLSWLPKLGLRISARWQRLKRSMSSRLLQISRKRETREQLQGTVQRPRLRAARCPQPILSAWMAARVGRRRSYRGRRSTYTSSATRLDSQHHMPSPAAWRSTMDSRSTRRALQKPEWSCKRKCSATSTRGIRSRRSFSWHRG